MPPPRAAILGWASLLWDPRPTFDATVGAWSSGGPALPLEFCRISQTRDGALTLVIDRDLGALNETFFAISRRPDLVDALADLRAREGTAMKNIGYVDLAKGTWRGRDAEVVATIEAWAGANALSLVAWTDLPSNFAAKTSTPFTPEAALEHLQGLALTGVRAAIQYFTRAPPSIETALRSWLAETAWFQEQALLLEGGGW